MRLRHAIAFSALLVACVGQGQVAAEERASYQELIFCSRLAAGITAALQAIGQGDAPETKQTLAAFRILGMRAIAAVPPDKQAEAMELVRVSNDAVNQLLVEGDGQTVIAIARKCEAL